MHDRNDGHQASKSLMVLAIAAGVALASGAAGVAVFGSQPADAATVNATVMVNVAVNAATGGNTNTPLSQAATGAAEVAKSAGLRAAIGAAWQTAWQESWPFIKSSIMRFFALIGEAWKSIAKSSTAGAGVNAAVSTNAPVNAAH